MNNYFKFNRIILKAISLVESGSDINIAPKKEQNGNIAYGAFQINGPTGAAIGIDPANSKTYDEQESDAIAVLMRKYDIAVAGGSDDPILTSISLFNGGFHNLSYVARVIDKMERLTGRKIAARELDPSLPESPDAKKVDDLRSRKNIAVVGGALLVAIVMAIVLVRINAA